MATPLPSYPEMIMEAIYALGSQNAANKAAISNHIKVKYGSVLPSFHPSTAPLLAGNLARMKAAGDLDNLLSKAPAGGATVVAIVISVLTAVLILVATILTAVSITTAPSPNFAAARHHRRLHRLLCPSPPSLPHRRRRAAAGIRPGYDSGIQRPARSTHHHRR